LVPRRGQSLPLERARVWTRSRGLIKQLEHPNSLAGPQHAGRRGGLSGVWETARVLYSYPNRIWRYISISYDMPTESAHSQLSFEPMGDFNGARNPAQCLFDRRLGHSALVLLTSHVHVSAGLNQRICDVGGQYVRFGGASDRPMCLVGLGVQRYHRMLIPTYTHITNNPTRRAESSPVL
jgi:hypothetical protein